jgi:histone arginine demethylase JMJD6
MKDVWIFKKRQGTAKALAMYSYAWVATQGSKISERMKHNR